MNKRISHCFTSFIEMLLLAALLATPAAAAEVPTPETITLTLEAPKHQLNPVEDGLTAIQAEGCSMDGQPGQPVLPHKMVDVALPPDVNWESLTVSVLDAQIRILPGSYKLRIAKPYLSCGGTPMGSTTTSISSPFMESIPIVKIAATGQMRKWRVARLDFTPFQYDPESGQIRVVERVSVALQFTRLNQSLSQVALADTVMDDVAAQQFANYADTQDWYPSPSQPESNLLWDYVIITTNAILAGSQELNTFANFKRSQGHNVWFITETQFNTVNGPPPNERADKVRAWLSTYYQEYGFKYILLIGDPDPAHTGATSLPMKMVWPRKGAPPNEEENNPTDYYFADLTGNWDKDNDQFFGEYNDDYIGVTGGVDLFPEVYVGRIPFYGSFTDLDHILLKTIAYQSEKDISWRKSALLPMSFIGPGFDGGMLGEHMINEFLNLAGYSHYRLYQQGTVKPACGNDSIYYSEEELIAGDRVRDLWAANDYGIVAWWAHGNSQGAGVGYGDDTTCGEGFMFWSSQTAYLDDAHPAFAYQSGCSMAYPEDPINLSYSILKQGGIGSVGATRGSFNGPDVNGDFNHSDGNGGIGFMFYRRLVNGYSAGEALYLAKFISASYLAGDTGLMNLFNFNLYGDPEVRITDSSPSGNGYLSIPAAAFQPATNGYDYQNHGRYLINYTAGTGTSTFLASVELPQGAIVKSVTFQWYDGSLDKDGTARLLLTPRDGNGYTMAETNTFAEGGYGSSKVDSIGYATVDNLNYSYWVEWELPNGSQTVWGTNVLIEYTPPPKASQGYLSIPAAAFRPFKSGYVFGNAGVWIATYTGNDDGRGWYLAPVDLPQGATVTRMTFYYFDNYVGKYVLARMQRSNLAGGYSQMAYADSSLTDTGYGSSYDTTISNPVVDNSAFSYWVIVDEPIWLDESHDASPVGVLIQYTNPTKQQPLRYSLSSAAFTPFADEYQYQSHGRYLIHQGPGSDRAHYEAPVYLPQGAEVTKMTFWFNDDSTSANGYAHLCRTDRTGNYSCMADVDSFYAGGYAQRSTVPVYDTTINNVKYSYWVYWDLPVSTGTGNDVWGNGVTIDYTVPMIYLPFMVR